MSELIQCDGCKAVSPDNNGLHVANDWYEVTTRSRATKYEKRLHWCDDCFQRKVRA